MTSFIASIAALSLSAVMLVAAPASAQALPKGDATKGEKLFAQCKICHSTDAGKNGLGPSLSGVVGRKAGTLAGFSYSPAMKASGLTWKPAMISDFLTAPMKKVSGTKMAFGGLANPQDRADIIAFLSTKK